MKKIKQRKLKPGEMLKESKIKPVGLKKIKIENKYIDSLTFLKNWKIK